MFKLSSFSLCDWRIVWCSGYIIIVPQLGNLLDEQPALFNRLTSQLHIPLPYRDYGNANCTIFMGYVDELIEILYPKYLAHI